MTSRQFVKEMMQHVHELTNTLNEQEYVEYLEQLKLEIEAALEISDWHNPDEE